MRGIVNDDFIKLNDVPEELLERIASTPAAALGSTRDKPDQAYCEKIFPSFAKNNVRYFFYIGGNDSADTARIVGELAAKAGARPEGLPHPQDDRQRPARARPHARLRLGGEVRRRRDHGRQLRQPLAARHQGGRDHGPPCRLSHRGVGAGAAASTNDGPHLIYVPEAPLSEEKFLADVDRVYSKHGRCLIAASEGISQPDGKTWAEAMSRSPRARLHTATSSSPAPARWAITWRA